MSDDRRILYAEFTALPGNEERVAELVRELSERVRAEPGNLVFAANRRRDRPGEFFVYEEYANAEAFRAHIGADYGTRFNDALGGLIEGEGSELTWLTAV